MPIVNPLAKVYVKLNVPLIWFVSWPSPPTLNHCCTNAVGDEVLAEQRGSDIRTDLPRVLAELVAPTPWETRTSGLHRARAARRTGDARSGDSKDGVAEPDRSFTLAVLIEVGQRIDDGDDRTQVEPPLPAQRHTQQRLKHQVALHSISGVERHVHPIVVLLYLQQPTTGERIGCLLGHCRGRLTLIP